jgi:hypothetical protein
MLSTQYSYLNMSTHNGRMAESEPFDLCVPRQALTTQLASMLLSGQTPDCRPPYIISVSTLTELRDTLILKFFIQFL